MNRITFQWIEPCRSARLRQAQQRLQESVEKLGLLPDRFLAGPDMVKFADILHQARRHSTGDAFVWCNSDVILRRDPFEIADRTCVHGFYRTEIPSGEIYRGIDMYLIPHALWDEWLAKDIPDLWCGAAAVDWWITRVSQKFGRYQTHERFIDHPTHERSAASGGGDRYYQENIRAYNRWARRNGIGTLDEAVKLPFLGAWNNSIRDVFRRRKTAAEKAGRLEATVSNAAAATWIARAVSRREPFLASRLGWEEARVLAEFPKNPASVETIAERLWRHAGVFPATAAQMESFCREYLEALPAVDLLGLMHSPYEASLIRQHAGQSQRCELGALEPYWSPEPWSEQLAGRRVLVVHPFVESIAAQYRDCRPRLFRDPKVLPEFELVLVKPPQTLAGNTDGFASWSEALAHLKQQVADQEFDVAIVGCGAYGLPLGAFIKSLGRPCIHLGGAAQLLFGISGSRWREQPAFQALITEAWRPPLESERPEGWKQVEKGCYW